MILLQYRSHPLPSLPQSTIKLHYKTYPTSQTRTQGSKGKRKTTAAKAAAAASTTAPTMERLSLVFSFTIALFTIVTAQSPSPAPVAPVVPAAPVVPVAPVAPVVPLVPVTSLAPAPAGPTNITAILEKAGGYSILIRLLQGTSVGDRINIQLNNSNGVTLLAPTDRAFSRLKNGTLNSLTDEQKVNLIQFHVLPSFIPLSQFQTVSNPLRTEAGDITKYQFPLNITSSGNTVNISTGINKASIASIVYTDGQLAVYEVDKVLLPLNIFGPHPPPAPAPSPSKHKTPSLSSTTLAAPPSDNGSSKLYVKVYALESFAMGAAVIAAFWF